MTVETHEFVTEFPEWKEQVHEMKTHNTHFAKLFDEYHTVTREIKRVEEEIETVSDAYAETLKKKRLHLKDELSAMIQKERAT